MKNREKYADQILDIACSGNRVAVRKSDKRLMPCSEIGCTDCCFGFYTGCDEATKKWAESEYIEPVRISKKDKAFLDYIKDTYKYIAIDKNGDLYLYVEKPKKHQGASVAGWICHGKFKDIDWSTIELPMVKWSNKEPWLIEDLKKLGVCDEY